MIFDLALRNLQRNLRRTLIAEISIIFGVFTVVFVGNFIDGMQYAWAQFEIESDTGAFQVEHQDYRTLRKSEPLKVTMAGAGELIQQISQSPGVRAAYGKLEFSGMVSNGLKTTFFDGVAVDPAQQARVLNRQEDLIVQGKPLGHGPGTGGVVLGSDLASMLDLKIGDPVTIVVRTYHGSLNLINGTLVGTKNGRHFPSSTYLEMSLADSQLLLRVQDRVSQIVVAVDDIPALPATMAQVATRLSADKRPFQLRAYPELIPIYAQAIALFKIITLVIGLVLCVLVGAGIGNVMAMAVMERKREIGTLMSIGMEKKTLRRLFLAEGAITGALGAVIGMVLVSALTWYVASHGGVTFPGSNASGQGISIIPRLSPSMAALGICMPIVVALVGAWWPAAKAAGLSPVEALTEPSA
ncbi:ABC transporter permease [Piscinibacter terrae]|uniref:ABC transporter permease n=1 Tax=Piscinibacter terrae TaxID=2496871 RepID=A0A3N7IV02_9BURK|nr:FtsX-like permease family protein [Albitalea terrae]RQP22652.1 ABC transporter permease [Albitalea terrae]